MTFRETDQNSSGPSAGPDVAELAVAWKINSEIVLLLGWGRAILMQIAHPKVAAGVWEHSVYASHPRLRLYRFYRTLNAMLQLMFGTSEESATATQKILAIHDGVHGYLREDIGPFSALTGYTAHDPELLKWVHATLVDSFLLTYERFVGPLSLDDKNTYCWVASHLTTRLGVSQQALPQSYDELQAYIEQMLSNGHLTVSHDARTLAAGVLSPPLPLLLSPATWVLRSTTMVTLPAELRRQYGLNDKPLMRHTVEALASTTQAVLPLLPWALRKWPKSLKRQSSIS
jgi:uncharacterized protein (DUF2236 family)